MLLHFIIQGDESGEKTRRDAFLDFQKNSGKLEVKFAYGSAPDISVDNKEIEIAPATGSGALIIKLK